MSQVFRDIARIGKVKNCPEGKDACPCPDYSKEGLCDWPYRAGMSLQGVKYMTELLQAVGDVKNVRATE